MASLGLKAQTIPNASFESPGTFTNYPGYSSSNGNAAITGWTISDPSREGLNTSAGPFVDIGSVPNGSWAAFIQSDSGATNVLSTTITGLTAGVKYKVTFYAGERSTYGGQALPSWSLNGGSYTSFTVTSGVWGTYSGTFTATGTTAALSVANSTPYDSTVLLDNFQIFAVPTVTSPTSASITSSGATLGGNVTSDGGSAITERGVAYAITTTNSNPTIGGSGVTKVTVSGTTGVFTTAVSSLSAGTGYSFVAYAINSVGTTYTSPVSTFTTQTVPTVTTPTSANIAGSSATLGGNVTSDGGATITERGVVYAATAVNSSPTIGGTGVLKAVSSGTTGVFTAAVSGLLPSTGYSFAAYATNSVGTTYTSPVSTFSTTTAPLLVNTVLPPNGTTAGGTAVTIVGSGFTGTTGVTIGGVAATSVTVVNDSTIDCVSGAHAAGSVDVVVTTPGGSGTGTGMYTYGAAPAAPGASWTPGTSAGQHGWRGVASSADGSKLAAANIAGWNVLSSDYGHSWAITGSIANWLCIASSADGTKLAATTYPGPIWTSSDSGASWTSHSAPGSTRYWQAMAMSADGSKIVAVESYQGSYGYIWVSSDGGTTWNAITSITQQNWYAATMSADGRKIAVAAVGGNIVISSDGGATWASSAGAGSRAWFSLASSADGQRLTAAVVGGDIWTSTDGGTTWTDQSGSGARQWYSVASSADGNRLAAAVNGGDIYTSADGGVTWTDNTAAGSQAYYRIASSADGSKLVASVDNGYIIASPGAGPPTVASISPSTGSVTGGTNVTITGTFFTGATGVTFGGVAATSVSVVSDTSITCTTPAGAAGTASVVVTTPYGSNAANTLYTYAGFTYAFNSAAGAALTASNFTASGTATLSLGYAPVAGTNLTVINNTGLGFISGQFSNLTQGQTIVLTYGGLNYSFVVNYYGGTGNDLVLQWANVRLMSWGRNDSGQLGINSTTLSKVPLAVLSSGVLSGKTVVAVAPGQSHSIVLCSDGTVATWGLNDNGQLGNNSTMQSSVPVLVNTSGVLSGKTVVAVSAGANHSMALCSDGTVATWGHNAIGQLGNNSTTLSSVPVAVNTSGVLSGRTVVSIAAGYNHSMALCSDGKVVTWGDNGSGRLGNGSTTQSNVPVLVNTSGVLSGKTVVSIAAGTGHGMVICSDGTLATWGDNNFGQLGNNSTTQSTVPVAVNTSGVLSGKTVVSIAAGMYHSIALCSDGTATAWGNNGDGELGDNSTTHRSVPVAVNTGGVLSGKSVIAAPAAAYNGMALCSDGTATTWGYNINGQLGNNSNSPSNVPVAVNTSNLVSGERFSLLARESSAQHVLALVAAPPPPVPAVSAISPSSGSTAGGTNVTITGTAFTGARGVTIGGAAATSVSVVSDTSITCTTPAGSEGTASVVVTTLGGSSDANTLYTYLSQIAPSITTPTSASITSTGATLGGNVTSDGGATITERGVVYSITTTNASPTIGGTGVTKVTASGTTGVFTAAVSSLSAGTGYSFAAYATNAAGTTYTSPVSSFTTLAAPTVTTPSVASVTVSAATLGGTVASDGGDTISERGVVYSVTTTNSNPTIGGGGVTKVIIAGTTGVFATGISGLTAGTGYSFKAYATNSVGTTYTTVSTFTTVTNTAPSFALQGQGVSALSPGGWWRAENNTADSSGNGNDGTAVNGVTYASGPSGYGQAFHMNGSGQYISVPHSSSVSFSSSFTIAAWVRVTDRNNFYFIATKQPSAGAGTNYPGNFEFRIPPSGNVELMYQTGASSYQSFAATSQIPLNSWTHVAVVFSAGTSVSFYINGTAAGVNATGVTTLLTNTQPLLLGTRADYYSYFVGDLDEVSLFGSALSQSQVQGVYYSALTVAEDSGAYSASGFANGISAGASAESGQTVSFALSNDNNALFSAQPAISTNGTLTFTPAPNANGTATVTVTAMDNGGTASGGADTSAAQTFTITVTPVNDTPTDIGLTSTSIAENNATGATVGTLSTTDVDTGDTFTYTLVSGTGSTDNASFSITGSTLTITPSADYETKNSYAIRVRSTDAGGLFFEKQFTISITNVNEAPTVAAAIANSADQLVYETVNPTRSGSNIVYSVNNAAALAATTFTRVRYRMELTVSGTPRYADTSFDAWSGLTVAGLKVPDGSTPIAIQRNVTNMTVDSNYPGVVTGSGQTGRLEIWPSNYSTGANGGVGGSSSTYDFDDSGFNTGLGYGSFQVHNLSSVPPQTVLAWNQHGSTTPDIGFGNQPGGSGHPDWTFSNSSLGNAGWKLQISVSTPYTFALTEDVTGNLLFTGTPFADDSASLTVTLGVADGAITGNAGTGITVGGTALSRTFTGTVTDLNTYLTTAGKITYLGALNNNTSRTLSIAISDGTYTTNASSMITFAPVNDTPTDIALSATSIAENNAAGAAVGTLSTTDVDTGDTFTYTLVSGTGSTDNASFSITGSTLKLTPSADYETKNSYAIRVRSTDAGGLFFEKQFTISITNVNEAPTDLALSATSIAENNAAGAAVGTLSSTDADAGDTFAYTLVSGTGSTDNGSFSITGSTLKLTPSADYETKNSYSIRVRTTDAGSLFFEKQFTISITNVNEAPSLAAVSKSGTEDTTVTFTAANFTSVFTDPESDSLSSIKVTSLPATGTLKLSGSNVSTNQVISAANLGNLTYVPAANENGAKTFTVTASDGSLSSSPATTVTMTLAPVNDTPTLDGSAGGTWVARDSSRFWVAAAASANGTKLLAATRFGGQLYTSTDSGTTWTARDSNRDWIYVASSSDGTKLVALDQNYPSGGSLYTSTDSGVTWTARSGAGTRVWSMVASSADGTKLVAAPQGGQLLTSTDSGATWTARATSQTWFAVASSADGTKLAAAVQSGGLYTSTDSGATWTLQSAAGTRDYKSIASSADGTKLVAAANGSQLLTSTDSGVTWTLRDSARSWVSVASSSDGVTLLACAYGGQLYLSNDSGVTWSPKDSNRSWNGVAMSADANVMVATPASSNIYVSKASLVPLTINEDAGAQTVNLTGIGSGAANESQTLTVTSTSSNTSIIPNPTVTYSSASTTGSLSFTPVANASGTVTITVTVTDDATAGGSALSTSQTFTVTVTPVNDTPTDIALSATTIAENNAAGATVGTLSTTDVDTGDTFTYTLVSGTGSTDNASFSITGSTLKIGVSADYETKNSYSIRVRTTDSGALFYEKQFTISITDVNETPVITSNGGGSTATISLAENTSLATTVQAADPEVPTTQTLTFSKSGTDAALFTINSSTGALNFVNAPNYEVPVDAGADNVYNVTVTVTDSYSSPLSDSQDLAITVTDVVEVQNDVNHGWTTLYGGVSAPATRRNSDGKAVVVQQDGSGNAVAVYATGFTTNAAGNKDIYTVCYNPATGAAVWEQIYNGSANGADEGSALAVDGNGDVIVTGYTTNASGNWDVVTLKYAHADGAQLWKKTYAGAGGGADVGVCVVVDSSNNVSVAGYGTSSGTGMDVFGARYASDGSTIFEALVDGGGSSTDLASSLAIDSSGNLIAGGYRTKSGTGKDLLVVKMAAATGASQWTWVINGSSNNDDFAYGVAVDAADAVFITGSVRNTNYDLYLAKLSSAGSAQWSTQWNSIYNSSDAGYALALDSNGNVVLVGTSYTAAGVQDGYVAKYRSSTGAMIWDYRYDSASHGNDILRSVAVDKENKVIATGYSQNSAGNYDVLTVKTLGVDGSGQWAQTYNGAANGNDEGRSVAMTATGQAYVAGYSTSASGTTDFFLTSYSAAVPGTQTPQTITFANPGTQSAGTSLTLAASSDSGLTVRFAVISGPAQIDSSSNTLLNFTGSGSVTVRATQGGSATYAAATPVDQTFTVNKSSQTINFTLPAVLSSTAQWPLTGVASSGLAVSYSVQSGPGSVSSGILSFSGAGSVTVRASQAGDARFDAATNVDAVVTVDSSSPVVILNNIAENWRDLYAGSGAGQGNDIALQLSGNDAVAGFVGGYTTTGTGKDLYLAKYLADGTLSWSSVSGTTGDDEAMAVAVDGSGNLYVAGYVTTGTGQDIYVAKYNGSTGARIWSYTYNGAGNGNDVAVSLDLEGSTNVVVGAYVVGSGTSNDFYAAKLNQTTGAVVWTSVQNRSGALSDIPAKVVVGTDGGVVIAGISNNDAWTVKLAAADGTKVWQQVYNYANKPDAVRGLALDAANNVYIAAYSQATNYDIYTAKYAATDGTLVWGVRYNGSYNSSDAPWDMVVDSDSNVFVTGTSYRSSTLRDGMTLKYAGLDGTLQWQSRFNISSGSDENLSMALDGIGNPVAGGYATNSNGTTDVNLFKCNKSSGANRWQTVFEGGSNKNDTLKRLRCDPNGNVWMTGSAANASGQLQLFIVRHMPSL